MELNGIYRGVVEDNDDPKKAGRCKIRTIGIQTSNKDSSLTSGIPTEQLAWAEPCMPPIGGVSGVGIFGVPAQGAHVFLFFENGNIMQPRYFATAPGISNAPSTPKYGFNDKDGIYPKEPTVDFPKKTDPGHIKICAADGSGIHAGASVTMMNGGSQDETSFSTSASTQDSTNHQLAAKTIKITASENFSQNASGKFIGSYGSVNESVVGDKKVIVGGSSDNCVTGVENKTCGGMNWEVQGKASIMVAKEVSYVSNDETLIKSKTDNIKMEATMKNIEMKALIGDLKGEALTVDISATTTAKFKGTIMTTIGDGSIITQIKGQIIMIG